MKLTEAIHTAETLFVSPVLQARYDKNKDEVEKAIYDLFHVEKPEDPKKNSEKGRSKKIDYDKMLFDKFKIK